MTAGSIYAGGRITADDIAGVAPLAVVKTADTSTPASSVTAVNDPELVIALAASSAYRVLFTPLYTAYAGKDAFVDFALPSGAAFNAGLVHQGGGGTVYLDTVSSGAKTKYTYYGAGTGATVASAVLAGTILTSSAGNFQVQFGQNVSSGTVVTMKKGSELDMWKIG